MNIAVRGNIRRMGIFGYTILIIIINKVDITTPHDILYSAIPLPFFVVSLSPAIRCGEIVPTYLLVRSFPILVV